MFTNILLPHILDLKFPEKFQTPFQTLIKAFTRGFREKNSTVAQVRCGVCFSQSKQIKGTIMAG